MSVTVFPRTKQTRSQQAVTALKLLMATLESDRLALLTVVRHGKLVFMNRTRAATRGLAIDDGMIELVWGWLDARKGPHPDIEREWLEHERRQQHLDAEAQQACLARLTTAAKYGLRVNGDSHFDGEKITIGQGEHWEAEKN